VFVYFYTSRSLETEPALGTCVAFNTPNLVPSLPKLHTHDTTTNTRKTNLTTPTSLAAFLSLSFYSDFNISSSLSGIQIRIPPSPPPVPLAN
jgi:hypothetical protein